MDFKELYERLEYSISEFAFPTFKAKEKVMGLSNPIFEHILKIAYLYDRNNDTNLHWASEIQNWLVQCSRIKLRGSNKYPTNKQILSWLFEDFLIEDDLYSQSLKIYNEYDIKIDEEKSLKFLKIVVPKLLEITKDIYVDKQIIVDTIVKVFTDIS